MTVRTHSFTRRYATATDDDGNEFELPVADQYGDPSEPLITETDTGWVVSYLVHDVFADDLDPSKEECSGWREFVTLHSQRDADELSERLNACDVCGAWPVDHHSDDPDEFDHEWENAAHAATVAGRAFFVERYEHGQVVYGLPGESSQVDRQWDVTGVAGWMWADDDWGPDVDMRQAARDFLASYTAWCNGEVYVVVRAEYRRADDGTPELVDYDCVGGYVGFDYAEQAMKEEH